MLVSAIVLGYPTVQNFAFSPGKPIEVLFLAYARRCAAHGEPVLAVEKVLAWLTQHSATVSTGSLSHITTVEGVRVVD